MSETFSNLLVAAQAGECNAFDLLVFDTLESVTVYLSGQISSKWQGLIDAEDITQEAIHVAFRDLAQFEGATEEEFGGWVRSIARHRLLDAIKWHERQKRGGGRQRRDIDESLERIAHMIFSESETPSYQAVRHERVEGIRLAVDELSDRQKQAIQYVWLEQKTAREAAELMNCRPDVVNSLIHRAKQRLRELMVRSSLWLSKKQ